MTSLHRSTAWPCLVLLLALFTPAAAAEETVCIENATIDDLKQEVAAGRITSCK